ncbi:Piso0_001485 [Millerozyma farinosa CBS 7064]|uniref:Cysteine protease n=1 Tax=Pichia sorbitophila (strain ATCC MYA-4447 / BCRC 22081 / CBS 7064 / NBRC 10061 / NRRL Y-12695) TaxID=559304 RepID=G8YKX3_PICSO|nr:Piso0_001485 [Millerozyma farinosa CBS 7064]
MYNGGGSSTDDNDSPNNRVLNSASQNLLKFWNQLVAPQTAQHDCDSQGEVATNSGTASTKETESIVSILGRRYGSGSKEEMDKDIYSRIWFTYRTGFEPIPKDEDGPQPLSFVHSMIFNKNPIPSALDNIHGLFNNQNFTTDVGWGCMIRTSQMLLANAIQLLLLGRGFTYADSSEKKHSDIIDMFTDDPKAPFSLHNFIKAASDSPLKVKPGEWFGPNAASISIKRLCKSQFDESSSPRFRVIISESCDIYDDKIGKLLQENEDAEGAILILLPVRLGLNKVSPYYHNSLSSLFSSPQLVGIAGGKPSSSYYFFGSHNGNLLYLDPHYPQSVKASSIYDTFHTHNVQSLKIEDMDPSMLIGILIKSKEDYESFKDSCSAADNKIIHFHTAEYTGRRSSVMTNKSLADFVDITTETRGEEEEFIKIVPSEKKENLENTSDLNDEWNIVASSPTEEHSHENTHDSDIVNISNSMVSQQESA